MTHTIDYHRKRIWAKVRALLSVALLITALVDASSASAAEHGWMLRQNSVGAGDTEIYATPSGFKLVYLVSGLTILATAPTWNSQIFNPRKQARYTENLHDLGREIGSLVATMSEEYVVTDWHKDKVATVLGQRAIRYKFAGKFSKSGLFTGETCFAMDIPIYKELAEYFSIASVLPDIRSVRLLPLTIKIRRNGHSVEPVSTKEIRPFTPPPHFWEVPSNYKKGKCAFDIGGGNFTDDMKDEMESWGKHL